jgi:hypothetical protein
MKRQRPKGRGGRIPGIPVPSTEKSRAAARVAGWKHGKFAKTVTAGEVFERRLSEIESGKLGSDEDRAEIRRLQIEVEHCEQCDFHVLDAQMFRVALQDLVFAARKAALLKG